MRAQTTAFRAPILRPLRQRYVVYIVFVTLDEQNATIAPNHRGFADARYLSRPQPSRRPSRTPRQRRAPNQLQSSPNQLQQRHLCATDVHSCRAPSPCPPRARMRGSLRDGPWDSAEISSCGFADILDRVLKYRSSSAPRPRPVSPRGSSVAEL